MMRSQPTQWTRAEEKLKINMSIADTTSDVTTAHDLDQRDRRREVRRAIGWGVATIVLVAVALLVLLAAAVLLPRYRGIADPTPSTAIAAAEQGDSISALPDDADVSVSTSPATVESCSAESMGRPRPQDGLPGAVAARRAAILDAALACDYDALRAQMAAGFVASLGRGDPIELWRAQEVNGLQPMATLVSLLSMPHATITFDEGPESPLGEQRVEVWPSAATFGVWGETPSADREAVAGVHTPEEIDVFAELGYYAGYRLGIDEAGNWTYFLAGD